MPHLGTGVVVVPVSTDLWLQRFGSPKEVDSHGYGPLTYAAIEGRVDVATRLLDAGAPVEGALRRAYAPLFGMKGQTNLMWAAWADDNAAMIQLLLSRGADPTRHAGDIKMSALGFACMLGHVSNVEALIEAQSSLLDRPIGIGEAALIYMAFGAQPRALEWIIQKYPERVTDERTGMSVGWLELACAANVSDTDTLNVLLAHQLLDVNHYEPTNASKAMTKLVKISKLALRFRSHTLRTFELFGIGHATALHMAAYHGNLLAIDKLIQAGADVSSTKHPLKMTPLHAAAYNGHREACERLFAAGAPVSARNGRGHTAAAMASRRKHSDLARALVTEFV